jgi:pyruvate/2-oxoglutarate dehydrogenase complex dihydrolipoamide acyltransferase (E2) component
MCFLRKGVYRATRRQMARARGWANSNVGGAWLLPGRDLTFRLTQEGSAVRGEFGNKALTYEVAGTERGTKAVPELEARLRLDRSPRQRQRRAHLVAGRRHPLRQLPAGRPERELDADAPAGGADARAAARGPSRATVPVAAAAPKSRRSSHDAGGSRSGVQAISGPGGRFGPKGRLQHQAPRAFADRQAEVTARPLIPPAPSPAA